MASKHAQTSLAADWPHRIDASQIKTTPQSFYMNADDAVRKNLSRRLGVKEIESIEATLNISLVSGRIYVDGRLKAKVVQECVITTDLIEDYVEEQFEAWFVDKDQAVSFADAKKNMQSQKGHVEVEITDESDAPEPLVDGHIEAGDLVGQFLSLAIDPYPHKEGAAHDVTDENFQATKSPAERKSPFDALKNWKSKKE